MKMGVQVVSKAGPTVSKMATKAGPFMTKVVGNGARLLRAVDKKKYLGKYADEVVGFAKQLRGTLKINNPYK